MGVSVLQTTPAVTSRPLPFPPPVAGKNFGFVNMPSYDQAVNAINALNGSQPGTKIPIQVSLRQ